jgi:hypothetical protein
MTFTLRVAGVAIRVVSDDPALNLLVPAPARPFLDPSAGADVAIHVCRAPALREPAGPPVFDSGGVWRLYRQGEGFVFSLASASSPSALYKLARFDRRFTEGTLWIRDSSIPAGGAIDPLEFPLPELVMVHHLAGGRGVEIHGCGILDRDGRAWLFAGQSGAGKSTTANIWQREGAIVLSDDRVVLRMRDGRPWIHGTPWHGEDAYADPRSAPLSAVFFLEHGGANRIRPVGGADAVARLFSCAFVPFHDQAALGLTLEWLANLVRLVPCAVLSFEPDARVVPLVRG